MSNMSNLWLLRFMVAAQRCFAIIKEIHEWATVACRVGIPVCLTMVGYWINEYGALLVQFGDSKPSEWIATWHRCGCHGRIYFLIVVMALIIFQVFSEVILFCRNRRDKDKIVRLESTLAAQTKEIDEAKILKDNISSIVKLYLSSISKALKMGIGERISFYILNSNGKTFSILARDSENADFRRYKRDTFKIDEGIIGLARATGHCLIGGLPSYVNAPKDYINTCKKKFKGLSTTTIRGLTMKSQFYYAFRFSSHDHLDFNSIIVVESMNPKFAEEQMLNEIFMPDNEFVYVLVKNFGKYMSTPDIAKKENM